MDWSVLACGRSGHVTYAPDEPGLREQLSAATAAGTAWRCLRCATFVPGQPDGSGPAAQAPRVRRGKEVRSAFILRLFAAERFVRGLVVLGLAFGLWRYRYARESVDATFDRERPVVRELFGQLGYNIDNSKIVSMIQHALTLSNHTIFLIAIGLFGYAVVELVESVGLWLARRWGEYFALVATSAGLPLEIYDLTNKVSVTTLIFLAVNLALVVYLAVSKRLLGLRGGKAAYEERLLTESIMEAAAEAAAAEAAVEAAAVEAAPKLAAGKQAALRQAAAMQSAGKQPAAKQGAQTQAEPEPS